MPQDLRPIALSVLMLVVTGGTIGCEDELLDAQPANYSGVGLEITMEAAGARVTRVLEGGGAKLAGIVAGDVLLEVNGDALRGVGLAEVVNRLRGQAGSEVHVLVRTTRGNREVRLMRKPLANQ